MKLYELQTNKWKCILVRPYKVLQVTFWSDSFLKEIPRNINVKENI